eukprot:g47268.t1
MCIIPTGPDQTWPGLILELFSFVSRLRLEKLFSQLPDRHKFSILTMITVDPSAICSRPSNQTFLILTTRTIALSAHLASFQYDAT